MLVLIGSDGTTLESQVSKRFGHAPYFLVVDSEFTTFKVFENIDEEHNHKNIFQFVEMGVGVFILGNIGPHAFELIKNAGVTIYLARKMTVAESLAEFKAGKLQELHEPTAKKSIGHHHHDHE